MRFASLEPWLLPCAEIVTVGVPFCVFKVLTGFIISSATPLGFVLIALGCCDLLLNVVNFIALLFARRRVAGLCVAEIVVGRVSGDRNLGLAIDVFFSFVLVAVVIGAGLLSRLPASLLPIWNVAVVLNVLGAGAARLLSAVRHTSTS